MVRWIADTATVDPAARLADGARVGAFCVVGPLVRLGSECRLGDHAWVGGAACIGKGVEIQSFCVLGAGPAGRGQTPGQMKIRIGKRSVLGRAVVVQPGQPGRATQVGENCQLGPLVKVESGAVLGRDVHLGAGVLVGRLAVVESAASVGHGTILAPGVRLGRNCAIGALSEVGRDIPPHMVADGRQAVVRAVNVAGLQRLRVEPLGIAALMEAFRLVYRSGLPLDRAQQKLRAQSFWTPEVKELFQSLETSVKTAHGSLCEQGRVA